MATTPAAGKRILLVEDNPINALLARALLNREGCAIDHAARGDDALAAVKIGAYDLILMDMRMPGLSGVQTARAMRSLGVETPIVALTAKRLRGRPPRVPGRRHGRFPGQADVARTASLRAMLTRWITPNAVSEPLLDPLKRVLAAKG